MTPTTWLIMALCITGAICLFGLVLIWARGIPDERHVHYQGEGVMRAQLIHQHRRGLIPHGHHGWRYERTAHTNDILPEE